MGKWLDLRDAPKSRHVIITDGARWDVGIYEMGRWWVVNNGTEGQYNYDTSCESQQQLYGYMPPIAWMPGPALPKPKHKCVPDGSAHYTDGRKCWCNPQVIKVEGKRRGK